MKLASFGQRDGDEDKGFLPTDFGCPDCRGVLFVKQLGKHGWLSFRCRVGHAYSQDSLLESKQDRLDESFWTALELLDELTQLCSVLPLSAGVRPGGDRDSEGEGRLLTLKLQREKLRALMAADDQSSKRRGKAGRKGARSE